MMLEFPTCAVVKCRSDLIASGMRGGNANHDKNATKNATWIDREMGIADEDVIWELDTYANSNEMLVHIRIAG